MFLTEEDYKVVIGQSSLGVSTQEDPRTRERAEKQALEEIAGYLRPRYDIERIFSAEGESRNSHLVMIACDIALYHLCSSVNQRMGMDIRKERYDKAIKWLEGVCKGTIVPDLPLAISEDGRSSSPIRYGSEPRNKNTW